MHISEVILISYFSVWFVFSDKYYLCCISFKKWLNYISLFPLRCVLCVCMCVWHYSISQWTLGFFHITSAWLMLQWTWGSIYHFKILILSNKMTAICYLEWRILEWNHEWSHHYATAPQITFLHHFLIHHCVGIINCPYDEEKERHVLKVFLQMCSSWM